MVRLINTDELAAYLAKLERRIQSVELKLIALQNETSTDSIVARLRVLEGGNEHRFVDMITPQMDCREIVYLWLSLHDTVSGYALGMEVHPIGPSRKAINSVLWFMHRQGYLEPVARGIYRRTSKQDPKHPSNS